MRGLQGRKAKMAGLVTIISLNTPGKKMITEHKCYMYAKELTCERFVQRYSQQTCGNCLTLGHNNTTCRDKVRCKYCFGNHLSTYHPKCEKCTDSKRGAPCSHTIVRCPNCEEKTHFAGDQRCKGQAPNTSFERKKFYTHNPEEMERAQQQVEEAIQGTEENLSEPPKTLTPEEEQRSNELINELQQQVVDQSGMDDRTTTLEKKIRARETMRKMENQRIVEEAFQKAFDKALNGPVEEYKCVMGCTLYTKDRKCQCWKVTPIQPSPTNYFTWEPTPHEKDQNLPPTQIVPTQEVEMEDFINPTNDLTKSEMEEIDEKMGKIAREAIREKERSKKIQREEKRGMAGWTKEDEIVYQMETLNEHIQDYHTTNGNCSIGKCVGGEAGYNKKGPLTTGTDQTPPKKIIATAKIAVTESGTMTMKTEKTEKPANV
jgi:hypothetical protein